MKIKSILNIAVLSVGLLGIAATATAGDIFVIAHSSVDLTKSELRDVYLGEKEFAGSIKLMPTDNAAIQSDFLEKVMSMEARKYGSLWTKKGFRGGLAAPTILHGDAAVTSFVKNTPGAVGYTEVAPQGVKLLYKY